MFDYTAENRTFTLAEMATAAGFEYTATFASLSTTQTAYFSVKSDNYWDNAQNGYTNADITVLRDLPEN